MKYRLLALAVALSAAPALAGPMETQDSLSAIIADYNALTGNADPETAAKADGSAPRSWGDVTPGAVQERAGQASELRERLYALKTANGDDAAILQRLLTVYVNAAELDSARIPFTGDWGFHAEPIFAALQVRIETAADAEAWIERVNDLPRYFADHTTNMQRGIETGWTAHSDPLGTTMEQVRKQIVDAPEESGLYAPLETLPDTIPSAEADKLRRDGRAAVARAVDAYRVLLEFLETDYAPAARPEPGIGTLNGGILAYAAALDHHTAGAGYSAEQIHALGEREVARIRAEMEAAIKEAGFVGTFDAFVQFLRTDPSFYAETPQELLASAAEISKRLDAILPQYFNRLPRLPYGVSPVPAAIAPGYTTGRYAQGDAAAGRAGSFLVNTYDLSQRPLYQLPALAAHEAVPGHHLQIALAQELEDRPHFRRDYYATAFGEGWALYAERVAGEAGIYRTPYERFGALSYEMWRACRLVADTGLHYYGWSRDEAEACFRENTALAPLNIRTEVTRYIGWPGQATAYKIGELKILELRDRAEATLGERFDIRAFHDVVLGAGSLPLDRLEIRIEAWILRQAGGPSPVAP